MKKTLLLVAVLAVCTSVTQAQTEGRSLRMGFKLNPNVSWMQPQEKHFESESSVVRLGYGFVADIFFSENYSIGTGVNIMRNGGEFSSLQRTRFEDTEYIIRRTQNFNNQYVEIPLTFKLRTNEIGYITYWGQFGFGASVNIASRGDELRDFLYEKVTADGSINWQKIEAFSQEEENNNFSDEVQLFRLSMIIAGGIEYNISGSTSILVGFTFNNGFTNMFSKQDVIRTDLDAPVFDGINPREDVRLRAIANSLELNLGILF